MNEKLEDAKEIIRSRKWKVRQYSGPKKRDKRTKEKGQKDNQRATKHYKEM